MHVPLWRRLAIFEFRSNRQIKMSKFGMHKELLQFSLRYCGFFGVSNENEIDQITYNFHRKQKLLG